MNGSERKEQREELTGKWKQLICSLLYPGDEDYEDEDTDEQDLSEKEGTLEECPELFLRTKEYFDTLPVRGCMNVEDFDLFETISTFRNLPQIFEPEEKKEEFRKVCADLTELLASLESFSK